MTRLATFLTFSLALAIGGSAQAAIRILPTEIVGGQLVVSEGMFTEVYPGPTPSAPNGTPGAGVYGAELIGGRAGAAGREIYLGSNTGVGGATNRTESEITWGTDLRPFTLSWNSAGLSLNISGIDYAAPASNTTPLFADGNTLKIFVKSNATLQITSIDGTPVSEISEWDGSAFSGTMGGPTNSGVSSANEKHFWSDSNWGGDGLTVTGFLTVLDGGGSARGIYIKHGNFTPPAVPEPASWAMLIAGFGLVGAAARRRRGQPVIS